jgi:hypothetical protein
MIKHTKIKFYLNINRDGILYLNKLIDLKYLPDTRLASYVDTS